MADQPIHRAAQDGDDDALGRELERDVSPNALDSNGFTPLHHLCLQGDNAKSRLDCLHMLLEAGANVNALDEYQMAPLHFAARNGNADVVAALLKAGADVNRCDAHNYTPLHWACMRRDSDVEPALVLLKNGAEVDARTYLGLGLTPLGEAIVNSRGRLFPIARDGCVTLVRRLQEEDLQAAEADSGSGEPLPRLAAHAQQQMQKEIDALYATLG